MFPRTSGLKAWSPVSQFPQVAFRRWVDPKGSHLVHNALRELELMVFGGVVGTRTGPSWPTWIGWLALIPSSQPPPHLTTMRWATIYHRFLPVGLSHQRPENHPHKRLWNKTISQTKHFIFEDLFWVVIFFHSDSKMSCPITVCVAAPENRLWGCLTPSSSSVGAWQHLFRID